MNRGVCCRSTVSAVPVTERPYGSWSTPITSQLVAASAVRLGEIAVDGADLYWSEGRPAEGGRTQLVRRAPDGRTEDLLPTGFNARTRVHEYGGAAWWVRSGVIWFANWADQRLYRLDAGGDPVALTPEPEVPAGDRYADGDLDPEAATIVCVREHHPAGGGVADVRNEIVQLDARTPSTPQVLVTGPDFVAAPRLSPSGDQLAYLRWNHPAMPWDATELVVVDLATGADVVVAGGPTESVTEPRWAPDGTLWFLSDRTGWWNLYRWQASDGVVPIVEMDAEIGVPAWTLGSTRYALLPDGRVVFAARSGGYDTLYVRDNDGQLSEIGAGFSVYGAVVTAGPDDVVVLAGSPTSEIGVHRITVTEPSTVTAVRPPRALGIEADYLSVPEHVSFPSTAPDGSARTAHALFYPPTNPNFRAPQGERPPLLVMIHGGPTGAAMPVLNLGVQYWTSRGFAVVDVNYGGSTGYGRDYREQLLGAWGIVDVTDCLAAAQWLADQGQADPDRLLIRGGSAGGYTTLAALAHLDTPFAAGADHFGVADLEALTRETHKFESRYLDRLIGPYPQAREVYRERSPISHVDRLTRPLIVLQGSEDVIVPPNQSEMIVNALRAKGIAVAYLLFDGEQHGFRRAENIMRALDAELSFYAQVLGFALPPEEDIRPVEVENLR